MKKQNIICVSMTTWEGDYMKAVVHTMGNLAKNNNVLFIDYAFTLKDLFKGLLGQANIPVSRMVGLVPRLRTVEYKGNKLWHLTLPPILPINWINNNLIFDLIMNIQVWFLAKFWISKVLNKIKFTNSIMINAFNPIMGASLNNKLKINHSIYYCYDEISAANWCKEHGTRLEPVLLKQSDLVVVTSTALLESKIKQNRNTVLIKNGVDFNLFHEAFNPNNTNEVNTIGYIGSLDFRVDYALLEKIIQLKPSILFKFIGRIVEHENCERLNKYPNTEFLGAKNPEILPILMSEMDMAIIPFKKNDFTRNIYPLKINEYLAAGLAVVSTDFADLSDFSDIISIVNNADEFLSAIDSCKATNQNDMIKRIELAKANDWTCRVEQFESELLKIKVSNEKGS